MWSRGLAGVIVVGCCAVGCERQAQVPVARVEPVVLASAAATGGTEPIKDDAPLDGISQAKAVRERLDRVAGIVNQICSSDVTVMLSETGRGGLATGVGIVRIDMSVISKVSEDALAGLVAHEFAHEVLGHARELAFLGPQNSRLPSRMQQMRELERRADEFAGWVLAQTDYAPNAFEELLKLGPDTAWVDPLMRSYYPTRDRMRVLLESYESARSERRATGQLPTATAKQEATP